MAKVLDDFVWPTHWTRESKYPWDLWLNGEVWLLERGPDFDISTKGMAKGAATIADRRGLKIRTHRPTPDTVIIQTLGPRGG